MSIIDNLYTVQSEKGSLTKPYHTDGKHNLEELNKKIIDIVGADIWNQYNEERTQIELDEMEHHYKHGLKDGAKLIIELIK